MAPESILIVSNVPAAGQTASQGGLASKGVDRFFGDVSPDVLEHTIKTFAAQMTRVLNTIEQRPTGELSISQVEVSAIVTADGKVGLLGSSIGGSVQGAMRFVWRRPDSTPRQE